MEKNISGLLVIIAVFFLVGVGLAYSTGYNAGNEDTKTITEIEYQNVSVPEIEYIYAPSVLDKAIEDFLVAIEDEEVERNNTFVDILGNYNFDELQVSKVFDDYIVSYSDDETIVNFSIKLKLDDGDERTRTTYDVSVTSEEDEDTIVLIA